MAKAQSMSGIYMLYCNSNNKLYIGSSKDLLLRKKVHLRQLKNKTHINRHIQSAYDLYGEDSFLFQVLEYCSEQTLLEREQYYMDKYKSYDRELGFNNTTQASSPKGYKHTEENKAKMSAIKKQKHKDGLLPDNLPKSRIKKHSASTIEKIRLSKLGSKNQNFGKTETEEKKNIRMKNFLAAPKWSKGLTKETSTKILAIANARIGKPAHNKIPHSLVDLITGENWSADSLIALSKIVPVSLITLNRLKSNTVGKKLKQKFKLEW